MHGGVAYVGDFFVLPPSLRAYVAVDPLSEIDLPTPSGFSRPARHGGRGGRLPPVEVRRVRKSSESL